ncbi:MAG: hypothetical protein HY054_16070 [Proteobacteria bacterium]|nr:hypothetical protein [Pseudomonadota bacterium]
MSAAAHSLCDLMDAFEQGRPWDFPAVDVHYNSLRLLRSRQDPAEVKRIVAGLLRVKARIAGSLP